MSKLINISDELLKKISISEDKGNSLSLSNYHSINTSPITNIYKNEKYFYKINKKLSLKEIEKQVHKYFIDLYYHDKDFYNIKAIDDIINNYSTHLVAEFKDYLIMGDDSEFLQKKYNMYECKKYLPTLFDYYKSCSVIFPNYVVLRESKYIFKNIRKKQKVIDNQQEQDDKNEKIKKGEIKLEDNEDFFNTKAFNSILNQTNTSNVKLFFGINSKNKINDSEETANNIFNNIVKAEKEAFIIKQNYILKKRNNKKNIFYTNNNNELKSKINTYNINNANNAKLIRKRKIINNNNYLNTKIPVSKIKNIENNKNNKNINNQIKILYTNKNDFEKSKINLKLNKSKRRIKSNISIFETDANEKFRKKVKILNRNNSSNKRIFRKTNSNKKIIKKEKKKEIITNKELISKIIENIRNSKSAVFNEQNSFHIINKQKKNLLNIKENPLINSSSIPPEIKINSYKNKNASNRKEGIAIRINESNSTPNIIGLKGNNKKEIKDIKLNNISNIKKEKNTDSEKIKVNNNLNIFPLNEIYLKKDFYNNINTNINSNKNTNYNFTSYNYEKNKILTNNNIKNKEKSQKQKTNQKENMTKKNKNVNLNIYKISPSSITQKYIANSILSANKAITISGAKQYNEAKYGSIKVVKKQKTIDKKVKQRSDINNNININININSNNIYNSTNHIKYNSNNISNTNNNITNNNIPNNSINNKKDLIRQYNDKNILRNESHPMLKKILLTSSSNRTVFKKNFIFEELNRKKININNNNNTITFSGYLTSRSSNNNSNIKNKIKNIPENGGKVKIINSNNKYKKDLYIKKDGIIIKNKILSLKNQKGNIQKK